MTEPIRRVPAGYPPLTADSESEGRAWVYDLEAAGLRHAFVRLVPRQGDQQVARSFTVEATVDLDEDGNLMGVMVAWTT